jgi:hypothetical protein
VPYELRQSIPAVPIALDARGKKLPSSITSIPAGGQISLIGQARLHPKMVEVLYTGLTYIVFREDLEERGVEISALTVQQAS